MLIINADDWGRNKAVTDNTLDCFKMGRITSASAMVFMADSERAALIARDFGLQAGLHLNLTEEFTGNVHSAQLNKNHQRITSFLNVNKYASLFYNPLLREEFKAVYNAQYEEFVRLYHKEPTHIDGHHHMHICTNMLISKIIPQGYKVRRGFSFGKKEKTYINRAYRKIIDRIVTQRYVSSDYFFSISPPQDFQRLQRIIELARSNNVELMVHPERSDDCKCLMSDEFYQIITQVEKGSYALLR